MDVHVRPEEQRIAFGQHGHHAARVQMRHDIVEDRFEMRMRVAVGLETLDKRRNQPARFLLAEVTIETPYAFDRAGPHLADRLHRLLKLRAQAVRALAPRVEPLAQRISVVLQGLEAQAATA